MLTFGHAGILYQSSFVMYDQQTGSLWVHVTGRAEHGPLKGKQLTFLPSTVTSWENWRRTYPHSLVLPGYRRGGFMGTYKGLRGSSRIGLAVVVRFKAKLYPFGALKSRPVINDRFNGEDLLVAFSPAAGTATAWKRRAGGQTLTFRRSHRTGRRGDTLLRDRETGSLWSPLTGEAVEGRLKGQKLGQLSYNPILNGRFAAFYPDGPVFGREG